MGGQRHLLGRLTRGHPLVVLTNNHTKATTDRHTREGRKRGGARCQWPPVSRLSVVWWWVLTLKMRQGTDPLYTAVPKNSTSMPTS